MPRMNILNTMEREAFNSPPVFSSFQRKHYFDFPSKLRRFAAGLRNPAYQLGFLLSAGYFKAARRFFSPGSFHPRDIEYVARQLEPGAPTVDFAQYHPRARQRHQHTIRTITDSRARANSQSSSEADRQWEFRATKSKESFVHESTLVHVRDLWHVCACAIASAGFFCKTFLSKAFR